MTVTKLMRFVGYGGSMNPNIEQPEHVWLQNVLTGMFLRSGVLNENDPKCLAKAEHLATRTTQHFMRKRRTATLSDVQAMLQSDTSNELAGMFRAALYEAPFSLKNRSESINGCVRAVRHYVPQLENPLPSDMGRHLTNDDLDRLLAPLDPSPDAAEDKNGPRYTRGQLQHAVYHFFLQQRAISPASKERALALTARVMDQVKLEDRQGADAIIADLRTIENALATAIEATLKNDPSWQPEVGSTARGIARNMARHLGTDTPPLLIKAKSVAAASIMGLNKEVNALRDTINAREDDRGVA